MGVRGQNLRLEQMILIDRVLPHRWSMMLCSIVAYYV